MLNADDRAALDVELLWTGRATIDLGHGTLLSIDYTQPASS